MKIRTIVSNGRCNNERGAILVWMTLMGVLLLSFFAFAFDGGYFYQQKRRMQTAADSAALAAAMEKKRNADTTTTEMVTIGRQDAGTNGFTHGSKNIAVAIVTPPTVGNYAGQSSYVQATITQQHPTFFASLFNLLTPGASGNFNQTMVAARAVAGPGSSNCIFVLHPSAAEAFRIHSNTTLNAGCGIQVNSTSNQGLSVTSNSTLTATDINVSGTGIRQEGSTVQPAPDINEPAIADPLSWLQPPTYSGCSQTNYTVDLPEKTSTRTIDPGVYCGGIEIKKGTLNLNPGVYIMHGSSSRGGLVVGGSDTVLNGIGGVLIYNGGLTNCTSGPEKCRIYIKSGAEVNLKAMQTGNYAGIAIFQQRALLDDDKMEVMIESGAKVSIEGTVYVPYHKYFLHSGVSGSTTAGWTAVVARKMEVTSNTTVGINANVTLVPNPLRRIALVE